jgi:hypothetical protein
LFSAIEDSSQWLLWLRDWGIFASEEYPDVWRAIRERYGETRSIIEAPGHLFARDEIGLVRGMSRLVMLFGWDTVLICEPISSVLLISISHDEIVWMVAEARTVTELQSRLPDLRIIS